MDFVTKSNNQLEDIRQETNSLIEWAIDTYKDQLFVKSENTKSSARAKANQAFRLFMGRDEVPIPERGTQVNEKAILDKLNNLEKKLDVTENVWKTALKQIETLQESLKKEQKMWINSELLPKFPLKDVRELKRFEMVCRCFPDVIDDALRKQFVYKPAANIADYIRFVLIKTLRVECLAECSWPGFDGFQLSNSTFARLLFQNIKKEYPVAEHHFAVKHIVKWIRSAREEVKEFESIELEAEEIKAEEEILFEGNVEVLEEVKMNENEEIVEEMQVEWLHKE